MALFRVVAAAVVSAAVLGIDEAERRFEEAIATFQQIVAIDSEDREAHYNLMLCYRAAGNTALAAREQVLYERFKADEAAQAITGPYRLRSPDVNNERQPVHEHRQTPEPASGFVDRLAPATIED